MNASRLVSALVLLPLLTACGAVPKKPLVDAAMKDPQTRKDVVETVLRTLDEHPEYDEDVYEATKKHPKTLARMVELASHDLHDKAFADFTTTIIVKDSVGTSEALVSASEQVKKTPATNEAVNQALSKHAELVVSLMDHDRPTLDALVEALLRAADKDEKTRAAVLDVMQASAPLARARRARSENPRAHDRSGSTRGTSRQRVAERNDQKDRRQLTRLSGRGAPRTSALCGLPCVPPFLRGAPLGRDSNRTRRRRGRKRRTLPKCSRGETIPG